MSYTDPTGLDEKEFNQVKDIFIAFKQEKLFGKLKDFHVTQRDLKNAGAPEDKPTLTKKEFKEQKDESNIYHTFGDESNRGNLKYLGPVDKYGGSQEQIIGTDDKPEAENCNKASYNYVDPRGDGADGVIKVVGHALLDVIPYIVLGNNEHDQTTIKERALRPVAIAIEKIKKKVEEKAKEIFDSCKGRYE